MLIINYWSGRFLALNEEENIKVRAELLKPFSSEDEAKAFWKETQTVLVHIQEDDGLTLFESLGDSLKDRITRAINSYEFTENISNKLTLTLSITRDEGTGLYLLFPNNHTLISHLSH